VRLWFSPSSEVPIYRQLITQIVLAILCGDLKPGERLPSTRELARRFGLHPNTISAGYRQLDRDGWTETRSGSGVYVRDNTVPPTTPEQVLDYHIAGFFKAVRELDLPSAAIRHRVAQWLAAPPPDHLLLIDPDPELSRILLTEIKEATTFPVKGISIEDAAIPENLIRAIPLCRPSKTKSIRAILPYGIELITLQIRSANGWLTPWLPVPQGHLFGVASHWPEFLSTARTVLIAAGLTSDTLIFRDARQPRWNRGLDHATAILCDAYTATVPSMPSSPHTLIFPFLADSTLADLARHSNVPTAL
jgi:DNA-binding transcriptional regulator YhcF (GntR family)